MNDEPTISVMLTVREADALCRAWSGDDDAIMGPLVPRAIEAVADALDQYETAASSTEHSPFFKSTTKGDKDHG